MMVFSCRADAPVLRMSGKKEPTGMAVKQPPGANVAGNGRDGPQTLNKELHAKASC